MGMKNQMIHKNTIVIGDLNIPLSQRDRSTRQKISNEITELNHTYEKMDLVDVYSVPTNHIRIYILLS